VLFASLSNRLLTEASTRIVNVVGAIDFQIPVFGYAYHGTIAHLLRNERSTGGNNGSALGDV
jgi:hypothetical protein